MKWRRGRGVYWEAMRLIAEEYRTKTGNLLRPNDLSLPLGGLFDITGGWRTSHYEHRLGSDIDFNRAPVVIAQNGSETTPDIECEFDKDFVEAVNKVLAPFPNREVVITLPNGTQKKFRTAVLCEKNLNNCKRCVKGTAYLTADFLTVIIVGDHLCGRFRQ